MHRQSHPHTRTHTHTLCQLCQQLDGTITRLFRIKVAQAASKWHAVHGLRGFEKVTAMTIVFLMMCLESDDRHIMSLDGNVGSAPHVYEEYEKFEPNGVQPLRPM